MWSLITSFFKALTSMKDAKGNLGKEWWRSKTLWINVVAIAGVITSNYLGIQLDADASVGILAVVNFVLRLMTNEPTGFID